MRLIKTTYCLLFLFLFLNSCGTLFQGYFYNVKLSVPDNTMVFDSNNYEIPIFIYDFSKYIELRTSENHDLNFVLDSHLNKVSIKPKMNYLTFLIDLYPSLFMYGLPLAIDCGNCNIFKFDDINLTVEDFKQQVEDSNNYIRISNPAYMNKIIKDSINDYQRGLVLDNSILSLFVGFGTNSLGWVVFLVPSHGAIGLKCKIVNGLDVAFKADYNACDEAYSAKYSGGAFRFTVEPRYYPFKDDSWYLSAGMNYFSTQFEKSFLRHDIIGPVFSHMYGVSVGAGYGGKWWFVDAAYSLGFEKIRLEGEKPFILNYFTLGFYFNLPF